MAHYSEMDFLFAQTSRDNVNRILDTNSTNNTRNIFRDPSATNSYVVYKTKYNEGTPTIKNYLKERVYDSMKTGNPYVDILNFFNITSGKPGAGLRIKAADLAYLRDLGVYPINRMIVLRRFPEGVFVPENLDEMSVEPISTVIGWIKPDQNFGTINFNETWSRTNERFDVALSEILKKATGSKVDVANLVPIPDFAQGLLFEFYRRAGLTERTQEGESSVDESYEIYNQNKVTQDALDAGVFFDKNGKPIHQFDNNTRTGATDADKSWGLTNIPIGDPNVLQEGPFRNPEGQNIQSAFQFDIETTYEQKLLGDVDPGSAMLDIIDNLYAMGTSNMVFYWGSDSKTVTDAKNAIANKANNLNSWWIFVSQLMIKFWETIKSLFQDLKNTIVEKAEDAKRAYEANSGNTGSTFTNIFKGQAEDLGNFITSTLESILTSTIAIHRFRLRGSLELMIGGKDSSTPWYLTLGNPYSPWLATNHIIVSSASIETSTEMGFNDQPQWIKAKFTCQFSRALGKQELMRMFNNTFRRTYSSLPVNTGQFAPSTPDTTTFEPL